MENLALIDSFSEFKDDKFGFFLKRSRKIANYMRTSADRLDTPPPVDPEIQKRAEETAENLLRQNKPVPREIPLNVRVLDL